MTTKFDHNIEHKEVIEIQASNAVIKGSLSIPENPKGIILFVHGAGSNRHNPRNKYVANILQSSGFTTLLIDLLSEEEDQFDMFVKKLKFDIPFLAGRVDDATGWIMQNNMTSKMPIGYYGVSIGAAAALVASIQRHENISAIVCRSGRTDLADQFLSNVKPPTLLITGSEDKTVLEKNQISFQKLNTKKELIVVSGANHNFEETGNMDEVAEHTRNWFEEFLTSNHKHSNFDCPQTHIDSYSFGNIVINGIEYNEDVIIFPDFVKTNWKRNNTHVLRVEDLLEEIDYKPELLVVGTGSAGRMLVEPVTRDSLHQECIKVKEETTGKAIKIFNEEIIKGTDVVGVFHLTC